MPSPSLSTLPSTVAVPRCLLPTPLVWRPIRSSASWLRGKCGCNHLVKTVAFPTYEGPAIALNENFGVEAMFRSESAKLGLFLAEIDGHLTPCGYIPADDDDDACSVTPLTMPSLALEADDEYPVIPNTPDFHTDTEVEEEEELPTELTEDAFQSYVESAGLDEYFDANVSSDPSNYSFGIYISSMEDLTENVKLLRKSVKSAGFKSKIIADEDDEDETFLIIKRPN